MKGNENEMKIVMKIIMKWRKWNNENDRNEEKRKMKMKWWRQW